MIIRVPAHLEPNNHAHTLLLFFLQGTQALLTQFLFVFPTVLVVALVPASGLFGQA